MKRIRRLIAGLTLAALAVLGHGLTDEPTATTQDTTWGAPTTVVPFDTTWG